MGKKLKNSPKKWGIDKGNNPAPPGLENRDFNFVYWILMLMNLV